MHEQAALTTATREADLPKLIEHGRITERGDAEGIDPHQLQCSQEWGGKLLPADETRRRRGLLLEEMG